MASLRLLPRRSRELQPRPPPGASDGGVLAHIESLTGTGQTSPDLYRRVRARRATAAEIMAAVEETLELRQRVGANVHDTSTDGAP